ncbi:hypothetical protein BGZ76_011059 [Entomortierella beljakovae]|nr:hypothetical protein BGZ76_011059 [Entomortierella beljakovae]
MLLLGPDLPSQTSGSSFVGSCPSSARSSLQSIDIRFANRLLGPGTVSSKLNTSDRFCVGGEDLSLKFMLVRRANVARQSELESVSDILTLNFIFNEAFLAANLSTEALCAIETELPLPDDSEALALAKGASFAARNNYFTSRRFIRSMTTSSIMQEILSEMVSTAVLFMPRSTLRQNEDTYIHHAIRAVLIGTFGGMEIIPHWTRDPLPTPNGYEEVYNPDFFGERDGFPFIIAEVKKPDTYDSTLDQDARKVPHMMKIALDRMWLAGIEHATVVGLLIQDRQCHVMTMSLPYEAMYLTRTIGCFEIPDDKAQLGLLLPAIAPLAYAKSITAKTLDAIIHRPNKPPEKPHP